MKSINIFAILAFFAIASALQPQEAFHEKLQNNINPDGITHVNVKHFKSCGRAGARCLKLAPGARAKDAAYYTVNSTKAKCNATWKLPGGNGEERNSGECIAHKRVNYLIECRKAKNANNESNWIGVYFNDDDANFMAFGDAKARFVHKSRTGTLTDKGSTKAKNPIVEVKCPRSD